MNKKRIGILTGGGDVPPLNAILAAASREASQRNVRLVGFLNGWQGVLDNRSIPLAGLAIDPIIGGTILKSSRVNLAKVTDGVTRARETLRQLKLEGLIVIGGEDTLSNSLLLRDFPQALIAKTIDNDVGVLPRTAGIRPEKIGNYFTLGFPTAARKIASFVSLEEGLRTTAYSHERIIVVESMGMHAGWLALASTLGRPDFIVIPEFPLDYQRLKEQVVRRYEKQKNVIVVVAEGSRWEDGAYLSADETEKDSFGHPKFKGAAEVLARKLKGDLGKYFDTRNVNSVNPSYLYRSGAPCPLDRRWAAKLGAAAVRLICRGFEGIALLTIKRGREGFSLLHYPVEGIDSIEALHRFVDRRFYDPRTFSATAGARDYLGYLFSKN